MFGATNNPRPQRSDIKGAFSTQNFYSSDLFRICLEEGEISAASYIHEEIFNKEPIKQENIGEILETLQHNKWGEGQNNQEFIKEVIHPDNVDWEKTDLDVEIILENQFLKDDNTSEVSASTVNSEILNYDNPVPPENTMKVHNVPYDYLDRISSYFSPDRMIGQGGFSDVFLGMISHKKSLITIFGLKGLKHKNQKFHQKN